MGITNVILKLLLKPFCFNVCTMKDRMMLLQVARYNSRHSVVVVPQVHVRLYTIFAFTDTVFALAHYTGGLLNELSFASLPCGLQNEKRVEICVIVYLALRSQVLLFSFVVFFFFFSLGRVHGAAVITTYG